MISNNFVKKWSTNFYPRIKHILDYTKLGLFENAQNTYFRLLRRWEIAKTISFIKQTSWAGSATLEDISWARLIFQLSASISVDRLRHRTTLRLEQHLVRYSRLGGDTAQNSKMFEKQWGDTAHSKFGYMVRSSNKGGNIAQSSTMLQKPRGGHRTFHLRLSCKIIKQENPYGRWVGGSFRKYYHFVAPSCKLKLFRFSA